MLDVIPAILPATYEELSFGAARVRGRAPIVQVDICDGSFVPSRSWPYLSGGTQGDEHFAALVRQDEGLPFWQDLDYELDLMVRHADTKVETFLPLGASRLIFHFSALKDPAAFFASELFAPGARDIGGEPVVAIGLALRTTDPIETALPFLAHCDFAQVMGIATIGKQGEPFDPESLDLIRVIRMRYPDLPLAVDGGMNKDTAALVQEAGATRVVAGSAIFRSEDIARAITKLAGE